VADTYSALTAWRPYRDRWDNRAAFAEMGRDAKKGKFDLDVLESLGKLIGVESS
jgi:HD-GYP domain-containing protein (c-di-GMP phosphodiesterase class II)